MCVCDRHYRLPRSSSNAPSKKHAPKANAGQVLLRAFGMSPSPEPVREKRTITVVPGSFQHVPDNDAQLFGEQGYHTDLAQERLRINRSEVDLRPMSQGAGRPAHASSSRQARPRTPSKAHERHAPRQSYASHQRRSSGRRMSHASSRSQEPTGHYTPHSKAYHQASPAAPAANNHRRTGSYDTRRQGGYFA
ncbi:hypothetical protein EV121DRAFT_251131 [Schizophyllum commune]